MIMFVVIFLNVNPLLLIPLSNQVGTAECAERSAAPPQVAPRARLQIQVLGK